MSDELAASDPSATREVASLQQLQKELLQLRRALRNRDVIGQAKGMVRLLGKCNEDTAWLVLVWLSQTTNRKVSDVAMELADDLPGSRLNTQLQQALRVAIDIHVRRERSAPPN